MGCRAKTARRGGYVWVDVWGWVVGWVGGVCECVGGYWCARCVYTFEYISPGMVLWMDGGSSFELNYLYFVNMHNSTVKRRILFVHTFTHTLAQVRAHTHTHTNAQAGGYNKNGFADRQITSRSSRTPKGLYGETNCSTG